jgi:hypothetical protein
MSGEFYFTNKFPSKIINGLYLGSEVQADNKAILKHFNIKNILIAGVKLTPAFPTDFNYKQIDIIDNPMEDIEKYFNETYEYFILLN